MATSSRQLQVKVGQITSLIFTPVDSEVSQANGTRDPAFYSSPWKAIRAELSDEISDEVAEELSPHIKCHFRDHISPRAMVIEAEDYCGRSTDSEFSSDDEFKFIFDDDVEADHATVPMKSSLTSLIYLPSLSEELKIGSSSFLPTSLLPDGDVDYNATGATTTTTPHSQLRNSIFMPVVELEGRVTDLLSSRPDIKRFWKKPKCLGSDDITLSDHFLGSGVYGRVYMAWAGETREQVAIKFFTVGANSSLGDIVKEASVIHYLEECHTSVTPHMWGICGFQQVAEGFCNYAIVMEILDANHGCQVLFNILDDRYIFPISQWHRLLIRIIQAVSRIHRANVIIGDIKTDNIMVRLVDGELVPCLIDFGMANWGPVVNTGFKPLSEKSAHANHLRHRHVAPEVFTSGQISYRSDIFSLGCLMGNIHKCRPALAIAYYGSIISMIQDPASRPDTTLLLKIVASTIA